MNLLQQPIERKLSSLIGAEVTFQQFKVSWIRGTIEALGVSIAVEGSAEPILTIRRVRTEISIARALKKEIVVKSLAIERPVLSLVRRADGSMNLPRRMRLSRPAALSSAAPAEGDGSRGMEFEIQKLLLVEGEVGYRSDHANDGGYRVSAEGILADMSQQGQTIPFTLIADSVGRRDRPCDLGVMRLAGRLVNAPDLGHLSGAELQAEGTLGETHLHVRSPSLKRREVEVNLDGRIELAMLMALVPPSFGLLRGLAVGVIAGLAQVSLQIRYAPATGLKIPSAHFQLQDASIAFGSER